MKERTIEVEVDGEIVEMEVLFTFEADPNDAKHKGNKYVVYFNPKEEELGLFASRYDDEGNLIEIDSDEEWDMVSEIVTAFYEENKDFQADIDDQFEEDDKDDDDDDDDDEDDDDDDEDDDDDDEDDDDDDEDDDD